MGEAALRCVDPPASAVQAVETTGLHRQGHLLLFSCSFTSFTATSTANIPFLDVRNPVVVPNGFFF